MSAITSTAAPSLKRGRRVTVTTTTLPASKWDELVDGGHAGDRVTATTVPAAAVETSATGVAERNRVCSGTPRASCAGTTVATEAAQATGGKKLGCKGLRGADINLPVNRDVTPRQ